MPTGLIHWSGHFEEKLGGYFKIRTKSRQNDKNLSGQNLPSAEQASVRIIRGPAITRHVIMTLAALALTGLVSASPLLLSILKLPTVNTPGHRSASLRVNRELCRMKRTWTTVVSSKDTVVLTSGGDAIYLPMAF